MRGDGETAERLYGECGGAFLGIVRFWEGGAGRGMDVLLRWL